MRRVNRLRPEFVEHVPEQLEDGVIYISMTFATALHACCCGCGREVVTPFKPTDWTLIYNGESVSLEPSIGNWSFDCQSHYWIEEGCVRWAPRWSRRRIALGRAADRAAKAQFYGSPQENQATPPAANPSFWQRLKKRLKG
jgi:hypothetical protein